MSPALDVDDRDSCRRTSLLGVLVCDGLVEWSRLFIENFDSVGCGGVRGGIFWRGTRRTREPKTFLRGERSVDRGGSTTWDPNVLEDQRLRKRSVASNSWSSKEGEFGKEGGEMGVFEEVEDIEVKVESTEERGASESVLERGSVTSPYIPVRGISGIAGGRGQLPVEGVYTREG